MGWKYSNPVRVVFGAGVIDTLPQLIAGRNYVLVTYGEPFFSDVTEKVQRAAGKAELVIRDISPNPDFLLLDEQVKRFRKLTEQVDLIVAIGGGSVIDSAKVLSAANGDFGLVRDFLETKSGGEKLSAIPLIAVATTSGTGSEVTCWGTVWDKKNNRKYSLARQELYPTHAVIDPELMLGKSVGLTISTGLDALSHALESLWNVNANPVSANYAVFAARRILDVLPVLVNKTNDIELRSEMAMAALFAGLAFSNTRTAIAHSLSYPITLRHGVQHGIACSLSLPMVLRSVRDATGVGGDGLHQIFGDDLADGANQLDAFLGALGVSRDPADYNISSEEWMSILKEAFAGERGRNFIGTMDDICKVVV